ncbi:MAG: fibronectin type III domain-containing protein [Cytophagaceae bacterium]|nr:fibronectin type III domain-containing protein [Cytophagaceae bacterium]
MKSVLFLLFFSFCLVVVSCKLDDLPADKRLTVISNPAVVTTGAVVTTTSTSATVQMTVNSLGSNTSLSEYGIVFAEDPNNNPLLTSGIANRYTAGTLTLNTPLTVPITTNLKPGTRYFFRAYAINSAGQPVYGEVKEFTTKTAASNSLLFGGSNFDYGYFMVPTAGGGGIFAGNSNSSNGDVPANKGGYDAWVARYDANGVILWKKNYGGSSDDVLRSIQFTTDGNVILVGNTNSTDGDLSGSGLKGEYDIWVVKLNAASGAIIWQKTYGGSKSDFGQAVQATSDGGCIVVGRTNSNDVDINATTGRRGDFDIWALKLNSSGNIEWQKAYGGSGEERGQSVQTTRDGGYVIAGMTKSSDGQITNFKGVTDGWVVKVNSSGVLQWQIPLGGAGNDEAFCVQQTLDNKFIVTGFIATPGTGNRNVMVSKISSDGAEESGFPASLGGYEQDEGAYIEQIQDGSFILVANTNSTDIAGLPPYRGGARDIWVVKLRADGKTIDWQKPAGGSGDDQSYCIRAVTDGYLLCGFTTSAAVDGKVNNGSSDVLIVKMGLDGVY